MTPERWRQITEVFHAALARDESTRAGYLDQACAGDPTLREEVDAMLAAHAATYVGAGFSRPDIDASQTYAPRLAAGAMYVGAGLSRPETDALRTLAPRLAPGTMIGLYRIAELIGVGGMGEVYRARDTKLNRPVALKILPEPFANHSDRLARFEREAQLLASLNHPNIGAIHGLEESGGVQALVLELVEGPTLADRIERGPIPLDEALSIARQIAEALGAAHEQGIVHRDLKPANIKLRPDGTIKVLDFGLAKALDAGTAAIDPSQSGTIMNPAMTGVGVILGTAAYMSPEQAKGRAADKRSDIWGFGCVLYEMLSGRRAFEAEDVADTLAAVLRGEPDWRALPDETPVSIRTLIRACLEKDRRQRLPDVSAALFVVTHQDSLAATVAAPTPASRIPMWRRSIPAVLAVAGAAAVSGYVVWTMNPLPPQAVTRSTIALSTGDYFSSTGRKLVALSLDGTHLVYSANQQLYVRALDQLESEPLRGTEGLGLNPFLSPDGRWIGFWQDRQLNSQAVIFSSGRNAEVAPGSRRLFRQAADGSGAVEQLTQPETAQWPYPYSVTPDGTGLVFADQLPPVGQPGETGDLMLLPLAGDRRPEPLLQTSFAEVNGEVSPDGRWLAYQSNESGREEVYVRPFPKAGTGKWQISTSGGTRPAWGRNGRELFYVSMGALMSVPVTAASTFVAGSATRLFDGPYLFDVAARPGRTYDVSPDGQRFLMIKEADTTDEPAPFARIILVQNWFEELKRRVPRN